MQSHTDPVRGFRRGTALVLAVPVLLAALPGCSAVGNWLRSHGDGAAWARAAQPLRREHLPGWILLATTPALGFQDQRLSKHLARKQPVAGPNAATRGDRMLAVLLAAPLVPATISFLTDDTSAQGWGVIEVAAESVLLTQLTVAALKPLVGRERPNDHQGIGGRRNPSRSSFPSGHAAAAMAGATVTARWVRTRTRWWLPVELALYSGVAYVAITRIEADKHFPTDTVAGAIIGSYWANTLWDAHFGLHGETGFLDRHGWQLHVTPLEEGAAVLASWRF